jgi:mannose/fructose/N-acetylgalactosamine-specific phosphotransferase system component IIC
MTPFDVLPFAMLGAFLGLDVVSFPQAMISRPIVASTVAGAFAGDAERGLAVGAVLEVIALGTLPFGASRYPEWGSAAVVGGALHASGVAAPVGSLALAILGALMVAWVSGDSMVVVRKLNGRWARSARPAIDGGQSDEVLRLHIRGLTADFLRGAIVTGGCLALLAPAHVAMTSAWEGTANIERFAVACIVGGFGAATTWMLVRGTSGARIGVVAGMAIGLTMVLR